MGNGRGTQQQLPYFTGTLRFRNRQMEAAFAAGRRPVLLGRMKSLACFHFIGSLALFVFHLATRRHLREEVYSDVAYESFRLQASAQLAMMFIMGSNRLSWRLWERRFASDRPFLLETYMVWTMIFSMTVITFVGPTRSVKLQGYTLSEAFGDGYDSDSGVLLVIDLIVTCSHLGLPIRWFLMAPLEVMAILLYGAVVAFVGSEEPPSHVFNNALVLCCLVTATAMGKRSAELEERRNFLAVIAEKSMRCEAEYQLAQAEANGPRVKKAAPSEETRSEAVTDRSGAIFDALFDKQGDTTGQLELVAAKGDSEHWRIPATEVRLLSEEALGRGGFGSVQRAIFCGMFVAVKCPRLDVGDVKVADLCNELRILRHLRHPNIVVAHGSVVLPEEQRIYLVLELLDGPNLTSFILPADIKDAPSVLHRYQVMLGICKALLYMHSRMPHIVHGDLKSANVMIELSGGLATPKVLDFGLSRVINAHARALGGTLAWVAPEVVSRAPVRLLPMRHMSRDAILHALRQRRLILPTWPEDCAFGSGVRDLVQACLQPQPERRPDIREVYGALLSQAAGLNLPGDLLRQVEDLTRLMENASPSHLIPISEEPTCGGRASTPPTQASTTPPPDPCCDASTVSSSRRRSLRQKPMPFPELAETSQAAMQAGLLALFGRWNRGIDAGACCERHALFRLCQEVCGQYLATTCTVGSLPRSQGQQRQCTNCGILDPKVGECDLCGWEEEEPSSKESI